jgi:prevent-host-death family protein
MERIPIRTLNQDTAGVLARVERGGTVEITNRGQVIARIVPVRQSPLTDLIASGAVLPPTIDGPIPMPTLGGAIGADGGELLSALRDEERW